MGTYTTTTSLDTLAVGVTFDTATTNLASMCIDWAESEIDKKISTRYNVVDFKTTVPPFVRSQTERLSLGYLYSQLSRGSKESLKRADTMIDRVTKNIDEIANYKMSIVNTAGALIAERTDNKGVLDNTSSYTPTFGEDSELDWAVDSDKLDDLDSERD